MTETTYQLVVSKGPNPGQRYPLHATTITVGRDPMADIVFNDPEVSRQHVRFSRTADGYQLTDLGSTNGTFVNGNQLANDSLPLNDGDEITLGSGVTALFQALGKQTAVPKPDATLVEPADPFAQPPMAQDPLATALDYPTNLPEPDLPELDLPELVVPELDMPEPTSAEPPPAAPPLATPPPARQTPLVAPVDMNVQAKKRRRNTTILVVVLLLIMCCCLTFLLTGYFWWGDLLLAWLGFI